MKPDSHDVRPCRLSRTTTLTRPFIVELKRKEKENDESLYGWKLWYRDRIWVWYALAHIKYDISISSKWIKIEWMTMEINFLQNEICVWCVKRIVTFIYFFIISKRSFFYFAAHKYKTILYILAPLWSVGIVCEVVANRLSND